MRQFLGVVFVGGAVALCAAALALEVNIHASPLLAEDVATRRPSVSLVDATEALCSGTHYSLSPDSRFVAAWVGRDGLPPLYGGRTIASASITPLDCIGSSTCRSWQITQFSLFDRIVWSADGDHVFVFDRSNNVHRLSLDELAVGADIYSDTARLPAGFNDRQVVLGATPSVNAAEEVTRLSAPSLRETFLAYRPRALTRWRPEIATFDAQGLVVALVSDGQFQYRSIDASGGVGGQLIPRPFANSIQPVRSANGDIRFFASGSVVAMDRGAVIEEPDPGYLRPILDAATGTMIGSASEDAAILPVEYRWLQQRIAGLLARAPTY